MILATITVLIFIYSFIKTKKIQIRKIASLIKRDKCYNEWVQLNENVYFRSNLAFYYTDINRIKLYFQRKTSNKQFKAQLTLRVYFKNELIIKEIKILKLKHKVIDSNQLFSFESIEKSIQLNTSNINSIQAYVTEATMTTKYPINLKIKPFREQNESKKQTSLVCGKLTHTINSNYINDLKWWLEINRLNGHDKVIIYSMENSKEFKKIINMYKNFVHVIQFDCFPNFLDFNTTKLPFIKNLISFKSKYFNELDNFDQVLLNECYLENKNKYKYITLIDQDEVIIPNYLYKINKEKEKSLETKCFNNKLKNKTNIEMYLNQIKIKAKINFNFKIAFYLKQNTMESFFNQLSQFIRLADSDTQNLQKNKSFQVIDENEMAHPRKQVLDFKVTIKDEYEYSYAKELNDLYRKYIKLFYVEYRNLIKLDKTIFNRLFYVFEPSTYFYTGKTVYNTLSEFRETQLFNSNETFQVPEENGYVSDFNKEYLFDVNEISIIKFKLDLNYLTCYLKPIIKKFNILKPK